MSKLFYIMLYILNIYIQEGSINCQELAKQAIESEKGLKNICCFFGVPPFEGEIALKFPRFYRTVSSCLFIDSLNTHFVAGKFKSCLSEQIRIQNPRETEIGIRNHGSQERKLIALSVIFKFYIIDQLLKTTMLLCSHAYFMADIC